MYASNNDNILLIDDNACDLMLLKKAIKNVPITVNKISVANTLSKAKRLLELKPFSLIFLDLFLPDSGGLNSFTEVQKINPTIPIIIFSGLADKKVALKAISLGAQDFLIKGDHTQEMLEKAVIYSLERKKNQEIIKSNNERHESLLKVTTDILWDWDILTSLVSWSGNDIVRYLPPNINTPQVPAKFWLKRVHNDERRKVLESIKKALQARLNFWQCQYQFLRNDGEYDTMGSRACIIFNKDNVPVRMIGSMQNITEKTSAVSKLASFEQRFKSLTQNSSDLIALVDKEGNYIYSSDSVINVLGYQPNLLVGKNLFYFVHPDDKLIAEACFVQVLNNNFVEVPPIRFYGLNEGWRWLQSTLINKLSEPAIRGIIVNSRDITNSVQDKRKMEANSIKSQKDITAAIIEGQEKERSQIGRELHDNINQLLVASKLYIERSMQQDDKNDLLNNAVTYLLNAIEEVRKLSKTLISPPINEIGFIESVHSLADDIMRVNPIKIILTSKNFLQNLLNEKFKLNIFRIVQEQINNILKHAKAKNVQIVFEQTPQYIYVSIIDDGIGFNMQDRNRDKGVGISNIYSRAALYKGNVRIISSPDNGCEMTIIFNEINLVVDGEQGILIKASA